MTTIAYHHKNREIAVESRCTGDGVIKSDSDIKFYFVKGDLLFISGQVSDIPIFIEAYKGAKVEKADCNGLAVVNGEVYFLGVEDGKIWREKVNVNSAIGSGFKFALAAMDMGKDAFGAVEYACTRDHYSGGLIHHYCIETATFLKGGEKAV